MASQIAMNIFNRPYADPSGLFLATSAWPMLIIISFYLLFVLKLGRHLMANREPYDLRNVLRVYNLMQIVYNGSLFIIGVYYLFIVKPYNFICLEVLPEEHPKKNLDRLLSYAYFVNKFLDLLDTVFFVLRKSYKQISSLHLIHHLHMPISGYLVIRFNGYGGHPMLLGLLNVFVHVVMYSYYYLSSQSSLIKGRLWWKQYITILQMTQFVIIFTHSALTLLQPGCKVSRLVIYMVLGMSATMFIMFSNFYFQTYIKPEKRKLKDKQM